MWIPITIYLLLGAAVAKEQTKEDEEKITEARKYYPDLMVFTAIVISFTLLTIIWPYVVYKTFEE